MDVSRFGASLKFRSPAYLVSTWESVRTSYWFVPSLLTLLAAVLAVLLQYLDGVYAGRLPPEAWWLYGGNAEGARTVLGAVAGSMVTVASVVFSITIVALTLASAQFGPRLLRTFIRDRGNQVVLGVFIATFLYSLLVLRSVRGGDVAFVPYLSVTAAVALAIASLGVLIYFIHHVAVAIQADEVVAAVAAEMNGSLERLFPEKLGDSPEEAGRTRGEAAPDRADACVVEADHDGYVQAIDTGEMMTLACRCDLVLELAVRPGAFVAAGTPLLRAWPRDRIDASAGGRLRHAFVLGPNRSLTQDAEFGIQQLVEVAVRALSPGINDPFTAMSVLDRLGAALCRLTGRRFPASRRYDDTGALRVIANVASFGDFADGAFDQIRHHARGSPAVLIRLLEVISRVVDAAQTPEQHEILREHARAAHAVGVREFPEGRERARLEDAYRHAEGNAE